VAASDIISSCNSTLGFLPCLSPHYEALENLKALTRVFIARRFLQDTPLPLVNVGKEESMDLILHPIYATSQKLSTSASDWNTQAQEFGLIEIVVVPTLLAVAIRLAVHIASVVVSAVLNVVLGFFALCAYSLRVFHAILVFLNFPPAVPLDLTRRQVRLNERHRKKGIFPTNTNSISLRPPAAIRTFLYAPTQRVRLDYLILHDDKASTSVSSSKDLYDPRYFLIAKTLGDRGSRRVCIVKKFKKKNEGDTEKGQFVLKTVSRDDGGYGPLQFTQELRALAPIQESLWCPKLVASFAGPEDLHMLMVRFIFPCRAM
jgi:hypothetical protein